jgi:peptidoglycan/xylan/chitin deacetylase (PgdA/CDA1 family)
VHEWHHPAIRKGLLIGSAAAAAAWWTPALAPIVPAVAVALGLPRRIDDPVGVARTFDDGPHPEGTPAVLEALDALSTGHFFLAVSRWAQSVAAAGSSPPDTLRHSRLSAPQHAAGSPRARSSRI